MTDHSAAKALVAVLTTKLPLLCALKRVEPTDELFAAWHDALLGEDPHAVQNAFRVLLRDTRSFLPTPGDLLEIIHGAVESKARSAWPSALSAIQGGEGPADPLIAATLRAIGGIGELGGRPESERKWTRKAFEAAYADLARNQERAPLLAKPVDIPRIEEIGRHG